MTTQSRQPRKPRNLTDLFIASLKPAPKGERASFADTQVPGLKVRVTDKGAKSFVLWRRFNGSKNPAARSLGTVGTITLAEAREKARAWLKLIAKGEDPRAVERREREAKQDTNAITFALVFEEYLVAHLKKLRKADDIELDWIENEVGDKPYGVDLLVPAKYVGIEEGGLSGTKLAEMIPDEHRTTWLKDAAGDG